MLPYSHYSACVHPPPNCTPFVWVWQSARSIFSAHKSLLFCFPVTGLIAIPCKWTGDKDDHCESVGNKLVWWLARLCVDHVSIRCCVRSAVKGGGVGKEGGHLNRDCAFGKKKEEKNREPPGSVCRCGGEERLCGRVASSDDFSTRFTLFPSARRNVGKNPIFISITIAAWASVVSLKITAF